MTDPKLVTDLAEIGGAAWASREVAGKILGPTFEYVGGEMRHLVEKCNVNLGDIFRRTLRKLGSRLKQPGGVSPRVLKHVLDEGAFCDDHVAAEYLAGILAAARVDDGTDDRGVSFLGVIRELSTYQLRMHYLIYWSIKRLLDKSNLNVAMGDDVMRMRIFVPGRLIDTAFAESSTAKDVLDMHALVGLARHDLIESSWWGGGPAEAFLSSETPMDEDGYFVTPTKFGVELFLWAHGYSDVHVSDYLAENVVIDDLPDFKLSELAEHSPDNSSEHERRRRETEAFVQRILAERRGR